MKNALAVNFINKNWNMKTPLILMVLLSLFVGEPIANSHPGGSTHSSWLFPYQLEFTFEIAAIKAGAVPIINLMIWIVLLIVHLGVIGLPFSTGKSFFKTLLYVAPLAFILIFIFSFGIISAFLLSPFAIAWFICLYKYSSSRKMQVS